MDDGTADLLLALQLQDLEDLEFRRQTQGRGATETSDTTSTLRLQQAAYHRATTPVGQWAAGPSDNRAPSYDVPKQEASEEWDWVHGRNVLSPGSRQCVSCQEIERVVELPCEHTYCHDCIRQLFDNAVVDEDLFPPRCCRQPVPIEFVRYFLGPIITAQFQAKTVEYQTPDRTYCHEPSCATFIRPNCISGPLGICPRLGCGQRTCTMCKNEAHTGDCRLDATSEDVVRLAQDLGWQRCHQCLNLVELRIGCNHIR